MTPEDCSRELEQGVTRDGRKITISAGTGCCQSDCSCTGTNWREEFSLARMWIERIGHGISCRLGVYRAWQAQIVYNLRNI